MNAAAAVMVTGVLSLAALTAGHALAQDAVCTPAEGSEDVTAEVCVGEGHGATCTPRGGTTPDGDIQIVLQVCDPRADQLARQLRIERRRWANERRELNTRIRALKRRHQPTVDHAIALAAAAYSVDRGLLRDISYCESTHNPYASNGRYLGLYQFGLPLWNGQPFRVWPRTDPYAASLAVAYVISRGGIKHWTASRHCWGAR